MRPFGRLSLLSAALAIGALGPLNAHQIGPGEKRTVEGRPVAPPPKAPRPRDDTWTARRKAKAKARRG